MALQKILSGDIAGDDIPVLEAIDDGTGFKVWCAYCKRWHSHSRMEGHRIAHCHDEQSPYWDAGYILKLK